MKTTDDISTMETEDVAMNDTSTGADTTYPTGFRRLRRPTPEEIATAVDEVETVTIPRVGEG
jgi:hypothetical protein